MREFYKVVHIAMTFSMVVESFDVTAGLALESFLKICPVTFFFSPSIFVDIYYFKQYEVIKVSVYCVQK
jgi:hypothetical protein